MGTRNKGPRLHVVKALECRAKGHLSSTGESFCWELNTSSKLKVHCMFPCHQDINSILAKVLKRCGLRLAPGSEISRKLENRTEVVRKTWSPDEIGGFLSFLSGLICFAVLLLALFPDKKTTELETFFFLFSHPSRLEYHLCQSHLARSYTRTHTQSIMVSHAPFYKELYLAPPSPEFLSLWTCSAWYITCSSVVLCKWSGESLPCVKPKSFVQFSVPARANHLFSPKI